MAHWRIGIKALHRVDYPKLWITHLIKSKSLSKVKAANT
jgi:hypothetical protein